MADVAVLVEMVALEVEAQVVLAAAVALAGLASCLSIWNPAAIPATTKHFQGESCSPGFSLTIQPFTVTVKNPSKISFADEIFDLLTN